MQKCRVWGTTMQGCTWSEIILAANGQGWQHADRGSATWHFEQEQAGVEAAGGLTSRALAASSYAPSSTASSVDGEDAASVSASEALLPKALSRRRRSKRHCVFSTVYSGPDLSYTVEGDALTGRCTVSALCTQCALSLSDCLPDVKPVMEHHSWLVSFRAALCSS
jgi:hypothetical protein